MSTQEDAGDLSPRVHDLVQMRIREGRGVTGYWSRIEHIEDRRLTLKWPSTMGIAVPVQTEQSVSLVFNQNGVLCSLDGVVHLLRPYPASKIIIRTVGSVQRIQRREYCRVSSSLPVELTRVDLSSNLPRGRKETGLHFVTRTVDISGAGLSVNLEYPITPGTMLQTELTIDEDKPPLSILSRVVRSERIAGIRNRQHYRVAVAFDSITEGHRCAIVRHVFRIQRKSMVA